ncbi:YchJ family protein [Vibrio sp. 99-8-1]|uniref:YchJ family protein n=1 Tax=Vibrio sp. 99-8-1 TaxID=2607602 RepID=UPI001493DA29|nr:YchJ family protein [Vibrio sp. 99-8-1]NOI66522.1 YchJ family protein [Vibrio sp. 99-8-1]
MSHCPCGSRLNYADCCQPIHLNHHEATEPEQLMRARFSAHKLKLIDFVVATYHPSCHAENERQGIAESINLDWQRLEIVDAPTASEEQGWVEFKAYVNDDDGEHCMHERSRFIKENSLWYYLDGTFPQQAVTKKVARNEPCPCASGKKYKKCCGK